MTDDLLAEQRVAGCTESIMDALPECLDVVDIAIQMVALARVLAAYAAQGGHDFEDLSALVRAEFGAMSDLGPPGSLPGVVQ